MSPLTKEGAARKLQSRLDRSLSQLLPILLPVVIPRVVRSWAPRDAEENEEEIKCH